MDFSSVCITGGAGFVGSGLAVRFRRDHPNVKVFAADSLKRRGSELTLSRLRDHGVDFYHADVRCPEDLAELPEFDLLIDCSAEPAVKAGTTGSPAFVLHTNLTGTINCLELARERGAAVVLLSTSRVYPINGLNDVPFEETDTRFNWITNPPTPGITKEGVTEAFSTDGFRSFYGTSKLASEHLVQEYAFSYGMKAIINRSGVIAGPWQMGKVDQGVLTLWVARHVFEKPLSYTGWGGQGKQLRDFLHIDDLADLLMRQCARSKEWDASVFNCGGGPDNAASLRELTALCQDVTGNTMEFGSVEETNPVDVRIYVTDSSKVEQEFGWKPTRDVRTTVADVHEWILANRAQVEQVLG